MENKTVFQIESLRARLQGLDEQAQEMRDEQGWSKPDACLWRSALSAGDDDELIVEADGYGRATVSVVEGNWPNDYMTNASLDFESEDAATKFADWLQEYGFSGDLDADYKRFKDEEEEADDEEEAEQNKSSCPSCNE